jgi:hypothetical protein
MLETIQATQNTKPNLDKSTVPKYNLNYSANGTFRIEDLRISEIDLDKLIKESEQESQPKEILPWCNSKARPRRIDMVIERLFSKNLELPNRKLWNLLKLDHDNDDPVYDIEHIIDGIDSRSLDWAKIDETSRPLSFKSFENRLSDIRKFYLNRL